MKKFPSFPLLSFIGITCLVLAVFSSGEARASGLTRISDNVYSYLDARDTSLNNSFGVNAGIVIGENGVLVVDSMISAREANRFLKDIRSITDKPIRYVVNTHSHLDHTWGNDVFRRQGAIIIAHDNTYTQLSQRAPGEMQAMASGSPAMKELFAGTTIVPPDMTFSERMKLDLGGGEIAELIYEGHTHTNDGIVVYLPRQRILFAGDILFTDCHPSTFDAQMEGWISALDRLSSMGAEKIIPGHGRLSSGKDLQEMKEYLKTLDGLLRQLAKHPLPKDQVEQYLLKNLPQRQGFQSVLMMNYERFMAAENGRSR